MTSILGSMFYGLAVHSNSKVLEALPGKLDIKRHISSSLYYSCPWRRCPDQEDEFPFHLAC